MKKIIIITYDDGAIGNRYLIDKEDQRYFYMTNGFDGQEMRYDRQTNKIEFLGRNGAYSPTTDKIIEVNIIN